MASLPIELFYVNAKISAPATLSHEVFTKCYNDVHIPDILATSGIKAAYRYFTTSSSFSTSTQENPTPLEVERPDLTLYPVEVKGFLQSEEFAAIPVTSEVLPRSPGCEIFEFADFNTRWYELVEGKQGYGGESITSRGK